MIEEQRIEIQRLVAKESEAIETADSQLQEIEKISTEKSELEAEKKTSDETNKKQLEELSKKIIELENEINESEGEEVVFQILEGGTPVYPPQYFSGRGTITNE